VCSQVLKYAKRGDFEKCCEFHKHQQRWNKVPKFRNLCARRNSAAPTVKQQLVLHGFLSARDEGEEQRVSTEAKDLERRFEASLTDAQLEPAESVHAAHLRSRIPAMALT
jgi:hypothetical protein